MSHDNERQSNDHVDLWNSHFGRHSSVLLDWTGDSLSPRRFSLVPKLHLGTPREREEVAKVLGVVREPRFSACLHLIHHCGLRVGEAVQIQIHDIHGRENPPRLHVRNGKGGKDRYVPLKALIVEELRAFWKTDRHPRCSFPRRVPPGANALRDIAADPKHLGVPLGFLGVLQTEAEIILPLSFCHLISGPANKDGKMIGANNARHR